MSAGWHGDSFAAALGLERVGLEKAADHEGRADTADEPHEKVPTRLLVGPYRQARDAAMDWWEREYVRALRDRSDGDATRMAAAAAISPSYLWKISNR